MLHSCSDSLARRHPTVARIAGRYLSPGTCPKMEPLSLCHPPEPIMIRIAPTAWTALYVSLTSLATWLLCETDALGGAAPLFLH